MTITIPLVFLLLGWPDPDAAPEVPPDAVRVAPSGPEYEVMAVRSGVEIVVKMQGKPTTVRLLGMDTPKVASVEVARLNQTRFLRQEIEIGSKVRLIVEGGDPVDEDHHLLAQVFRASDNRWINLDLLERGFATVCPQHVTEARPTFEAAAKASKAANIGMWAPGFLATAAHPTHLTRHYLKPYRHSDSSFINAAAFGLLFQPVSGGYSSSREDDKKEKEREEAKERRQQAESSGGNTNASSVHSSVHFGRVYMGVP